jgi:hypothetical protein
MKAKAKEKGSPDGAGGSNGSSSSDNDGRGHMRGRGKGRGGGRGIGDGTGRDAYYNCGKTGYWSRECRSKQKKEEAHVAQDEESSLLLMEAGVVKAAMISSPLPPATPLHARSLDNVTSLPTWDGIVYTDIVKILPSTAKVVHLVEDKVFAQFSELEKTECRRWVLNTGATNHMMGCRGLFSDLDRNIQGTVKFGDGSVVQIEGLGTILFNGKYEEHMAFIGVYYIPKLNTNIRSIGQLDEIGFQTIIDGGVLKIRNIQCCLQVKVNRSPNRLYILDVEIANPVCLLARGLRRHGSGI